MKLTDQACKNVKPKEKTQKLADGGGLYLEVTPQGSKLWRLKYHYFGKEKKLSIGPYPLVTLAEARQKRDLAKKQLLENVDPSKAKKSAKQGLKAELENTFELIAREWYEYKKPEWSERNSQETLQRLEKNIFPVIGKKPIKEITPKIILELANSIKERGANELAKRSIQMCNHIFQYAVLTERAERNVAADLKGMIKTPSTKHHASIESHEIPAFMYRLREAPLNRQTYLAV